MSETWTEREAKRAENMRIQKALIVANCERVIQLFKEDEFEKYYGSAPELTNKLHELRRDSIKFENTLRRK